VLTKALTYGSTCSRTLQTIPTGFRCIDGRRAVRRRARRARERRELHQEARRQPAATLQCAPTRVVGNYEFLSCAASGRSQAGPAQKGAWFARAGLDHLATTQLYRREGRLTNRRQTAKRTRAQGRVRVVAFLAALRRVRAARRAARRSVGRGGWRCARVRGRGLGDRRRARPAHPVLFSRAGKAPGAGLAVEERRETPLGRGEQWRQT
jgi:hypothetical protein